VKLENYQYLDSRNATKLEAFNGHCPHGVIRASSNDDESRYRLMGRRLGATAAVLVFISCYIYGIAKFGFLFGVGVGWLPSGIIAWLSVFAITAFSTILLRNVALAWRNLSSLVQGAKLPM
jgi:hypothetical protein